MTWEEKVEKYGEPEYGEIYICELKAYKTKNVVKHLLKAVDADDYLWCDLDGDEINEWGWDVISWTPLEECLDIIKDVKKMGVLNPMVIDHLRKKGHKI